MGGFNSFDSNIALIRNQDYQEVLLENLLSYYRYDGGKQLTTLMTRIYKLELPKKPNAIAGFQKQHCSNCQILITIKYTRFSEVSQGVPSKKKGPTCFAMNNVRRGGRYRLPLTQSGGRCKKSGFSSIIKTLFKMQCPPQTCELARPSSNISFLESSIILKIRENFKNLKGNR